MPLTAAFIDAMRAAFGAALVDGQIRNGIAGFPDFWAKENDLEIGTREGEWGTEVSVADMLIVKPSASGVRR